MLDRYRESDLLAYVEDELSPRQASSLEARLASDDETRTLLMRIRDDRRRLRSIEDPDLPIDFVAALEPQLARPMLMDHQPGEYRRRHRRAARRRVLLRTAVAAVVLIAVLGGVWAASTLLIGRGAPDELVQGPNGSADRGGDETRVAVNDAAPDEPWPPADMAVHHRWPVVAVAETDASTIVAAAAPRDEPLMTPAAFALVVRAGKNEDRASAESTLARVVRDMDDSAPAPNAALVRNFSFEEASRLVAKLAAERAMQGTPDFLSGTSAPARPARRRELAGWLRRLRADSAARADDARAPGDGRQLLGTPALAASYEQQLDFSSRGATHTITIAAELLPELLRRLRVDEARTTMLRPLDDSEAASSASELQRWMDDLRAIRAMLESQAEGWSRGYVLLPVVVE